MVDLETLLGKSIYSDLDVDLTLDYMRRRYVEPLRRHIDIGQASLADCAAGYGWLSFAYLQAGGRHAILVDPDEERLKKAAQIAQMLGLEDRCEFHCRFMQDLDIPPADVFASIETLEHVGRENIRPCIEAIASKALKAVILTTPNRWFPWVAHDTGLPLAHWMPQSLRTRYALAAGRGDRERTNAFVSPGDLGPLRERGFRPVSKYQTFATYEEFISFYPHYLPYGDQPRARQRNRPKAGLAAWVRLAGALAGTASYAIAPNLSSIWVRAPGKLPGA
jgi:hypothetical protein